MRVLVLGGTRFLGRALVDATLEQGHEPTLFNRGQTAPELFPEVEKLRGDRSADLSALEGGEWDAVLDVAAYFPHEVQRSVGAVRGHVDRYVFVSSVSVYADQSVPQVEESAVAELSPGDETDDGPETYGARKAECERIVAERVRRPSACRAAGPHRRAARPNGSLHVLAAPRGTRRGRARTRLTRVRGAVHRRSRPCRVDGQGGDRRSRRNVQCDRRRRCPSATCSRSASESLGATHGSCGCRATGCSTPAPRSGWACLCGSSRPVGRP